MASPEVLSDRSPPGTGALVMLVNILGITDDAKCYDMVRQLRWPYGVRSEA
jgi:hypothetical protein